MSTLYEQTWGMRGRVELREILDLVPPQDLLQDEKEIKITLRVGSPLKVSS